MEVGDGDPGGQDGVVGMLSGEVRGGLSGQCVKVRGLDTSVDSLDALL